MLLSGWNSNVLDWLALSGLFTLSAVLVHTYVGYPLLMKVLSGVARWRNIPCPCESAAVQRISIVLCVHNEQGRLESRLENLLGLQWPVPGEILVVCDGCTDESEAVVQRTSARDGRVKLITHAGKRGKPAGLNAGVAASNGDMLVFCDARQLFDRDALVHLAAALGEPKVGVVSGLLRIASAKDGRSGGFDRYWSLETKLRKWESDWDSVIGCTGAIYAMRRDLYAAIPEDTLLDDVVIPMQVVLRGKRAKYCVEAVAVDPQPLTPEVEELRKQRTLAGNYQMLFRYWKWLNPLINRTWWQLVSHKYLRVLSPFVLAGLMACTAVLARHPLFAALLAAELVFLLASWMVLRFPGIGNKLPASRLAGAFLTVQIASIRGLISCMKHRHNTLQIWQKKPEENPGPGPEAAP